MNARNTRILELVKQILEDESPVSVRRLHYRCVSLAASQGGWYENTQKEYNNLGTLTTRWRKQHVIKYKLISDETRTKKVPVVWVGVPAFVDSVKYWYERDCWQDQTFRVEVWVEKDTLLSVLEGTCSKWQLVLRSLHGNPSITCCYEIAKTIAKQYPKEMPVYVLYVGDHDVNGVSIPKTTLSSVRDVLEGRFNVCNKTLNFELIGFRPDDFEVCNIESIDPKQISEKDKAGKVRKQEFDDKYGARYAEVDALPREILTDRIEAFMESNVDLPQWKKSKSLEAEEQTKIETFGDTC
jgi:hypothetical protein